MISGLHILYTRSTEWEMERTWRYWHALLGRGPSRSNMDRIFLYDLAGNKNCTEVEFHVDSSMNGG